jgi:signal transduction histidine kinase
MKKLIICTWFLVLYLVNSGLILAQSTILIENYYSGERLESKLTVFPTPALLEPQEAWEQLQFQEVGAEQHFGFTQDFHWVGFTILLATSDDNWVLEVVNPHINNVQMYIREPGSDTWQLTDNTGRRQPFATRRIPHYNYLMPIDFAEVEQLDVLLMLDKQRSSISYAIKMWRYSDFVAEKQLDYGLYGVYFGMFLLIIIITILAYLVTFRRIYLWYILYVTSVGLFIFNDIGLAHQYVYPWSGEIGTFARIFLTYVTLLAFILFTRKYFDSSQNFPKIDRLFKILTVFFLLHASIYAIFTSWFQTNATIMLIVLYSVIVITILTAIWTSIRYLKVEKYGAMLFIVAFSFMIGGGLIFILTEFGVFSDIRFLFTPIQIGSVLEILFLSSGLAWQVRVVDRERVALQNRVNRLQNEKLRAYIEGTEKERVRISMDLHDGIGNKLANLKRTVAKGQESAEEVNNVIQDLIDETRRISHTLAPPVFSLIGIVSNITQFVHELNQNSKISYNFQHLSVPEHISDDVATQLYRIVQECVQNIEKHSNATRADIQLIGHEDILVLTIEDDGVGISDVFSNENGIGLGNIRRRVNHIGGQIELSSAINEGVQIIVTIPITSE